MTTVRALPAWISSTSRERIVRIAIYAQPGAKVSGLAGEFDGALKIKISSQPMDGAANEALLEWIAQKLGLKLRDVCLIQGQTSRRKVFEVTGLLANEISEKLHV